MPTPTHHNHMVSSTECLAFGQSLFHNFNEPKLSVSTHQASTECAGVWRKRVTKHQRGTTLSVTTHQAFTGCAGVWRGAKACHKTPMGHKVMNQHTPNIPGMCRCLAWGGSVCTTTDVAVRLGHMDFGDAKRVEESELPRTLRMSR